MTWIVRPGVWLALAAVAGAAFGGPQADARAAAATAGTLFEAAPFLLASFWLERMARTRPALGSFATRGLAVAGCGCAHGAVPGALALPAIALTALAFGPWIAGARIAAGAALFFLRLRFGKIGTGGRGPEPLGDDPLRALERIGGSAFIAALAVAAFSAHATAITPPMLFLTGVAIGALAPCATAGIAIAAAFAHAAPAASAGMLATAGLATIALPRVPDSKAALRARGATVLLGIACASLALRGPSGLVNPRLLVPLAFGSLVAFAACAPMRTRSARPEAVPLLMLAIAVAPPGLPPPRADATRLDEAYAGEPLAFTGVATRDAHGTTLARYAITCCRIDASAVAVRLDRVLDVPDGGWFDARGTLVRGADGTLSLHADRIRSIAVPADPFLYR